MCSTPSSPASNGANSQMRLNTHQISNNTGDYLHGVTSSNVSNDDWPRRRRGAKEQRRFSLEELAFGVELSEAMASETLGLRRGDALAGEVEVALAAIAYDKVVVAPGGDGAGSARSEIRA
ncbi:hypothetical protein LR48_Vigan10g071900 [Vigna angularis]|uniref:Uncharacterized protein n=1 Tax=Phaseolus angularis TaxID=3914 RepID=A0A0L9VIT1_PHAAN|nr:hypothetical protein LR48_Vigan10g071900 [Vigna angularis]